MAQRPLSFKRLILLVVVLAVAALVRTYLLPEDTPSTPSSTRENYSGMTVERAAQERLSGIMIEAQGRVKKSLSDDNEGSRHQRFIMELASGHTVLVAHNIDLAQRVPLTEGDKVTIFGQYEWNDRGGVLHWTHHDPAGRHADGWIEHQGQRYR